MERRITDLFTGEFTDGTMASWTVWLPLFSHENWVHMSGRRKFSRGVRQPDRDGDVQRRSVCKLLQLLRWKIGRRVQGGIWFHIRWVITKINFENLGVGTSNSFCAVSLNGPTGETYPCFAFANSVNRKGNFHSILVKVFISRWLSVLNWDHRCSLIMQTHYNQIFTWVTQTNHILFKFWSFHAPGSKKWHHHSSLTGAAHDTDKSLAAEMQTIYIYKDIKAMISPWPAHGDHRLITSKW